MPELPEVEIVKRSLKNKVNYKRIKKIIISNRNLRFKIEKNFEKHLNGKVISNVSRFSKYIILTLENLNYCLIHLVYELGLMIFLHNLPLFHIQ